LGVSATVLDGVNHGFLEFRSKPTPKKEKGKFPKSEGNRLFGSKSKNGEEGMVKRGLNKPKKSFQAFRQNIFLFFVSAFKISQTGCKRIA